MEPRYCRACLAVKGWDLEFASWWDLVKHVWRYHVWDFSWLGDW